MTNTIKKILIAALMAASIVVVFKTTDVAAAPKTHTVTFIYGTKCFAEPVAHGGIAIAPTDTYVAGYNFTGWVGNLFNVTEDRMILGAYAPVPAPVVVCNTVKEKDHDDDECWCHRHSCWYRHHCPWCDDWYDWKAAEWRELNEAYEDYWHDVHRAEKEALEAEREAWRDYNKHGGWFWGDWD
ncbi:MAG: hypothetical protein K6E49_02095 [Lachnospiraceae bacterium]|nr:hypothetical protein [Lachnospiraceae bacterium]